MSNKKTKQEQSDKHVLHASGDTADIASLSTEKILMLIEKQ